MKRYKNISYPCESMQENKKGEYVKHDQAHALLKEAYEGILEVFDEMQTIRMDYNQLDRLRKVKDKAEKWLKENRWREEDC